MASTTSLLEDTKFEELCRLCGSKTDNLAVHIFDDQHTFSELGKKIYSCLQIQIHQQDELPKLLCGNCLVKLDMFWDFKYRSFRTEQFLLAVYKQLKSGGSTQQCLVQIENVMIVPVNNQILSGDLHTHDQISIPQLDHRQEGSDEGDYSVLQHNTHLGGLDLGVAGQDLSNHSLQSVQDNLEALQASQNPENFPNDNLCLIQDQLLTESANLEVSVVHSNLYTHSESETYMKPAESDYVENQGISDNSLGVEVHADFNRIIAHQDTVLNGSSNQDEGLSKLLFDKSVSKSLSDNCPAALNNCFKYELDGEKFLYFHSKSPEGREKNLESQLIMNYKEDLSLDSIGGFRNEDSLEQEQTDDVSNESGVLELPSVVDSIEGPPEEEKPKIGKVGPKICSVCGKSYKSNYKLAEHMTKHTGERPYKCKSCDKAFRSKIGLTQHEAKHTGQYVLRCPTCGKGFQCKSYLMVHQRVHSDVKPFHCAMCGINFKTKQSLSDHTNRHLGVKPFTCSICNRGFITKSLCMAHEKIHSGVDNRKYSCKICEKRFVSKSYLQTHSRIHTGEKTFICEVCGKGFLASLDLKIHLTVHTGEKSFVCEMCGKAFARRDALKCHRRMHTGERPYSCDICGRTFTQFTPMANHKKSHTGDRPFTCETCGKQFVSRSSMVSHQKKYHKRVEKLQCDKDVITEIAVPVSSAS
ncbi:zinc finger protein 502-like isoform X1 [Euwallacea similis]|uniref:zinc finger protein 502-like isoform X1 n=1 Tax=Euwallacea similis TaxID=1736056 RepID=UPI00344F3228